jgi:thioredoxin-like negative regulator of GroEL
MLCKINNEIVNIKTPNENNDIVQLVIAPILQVDIEENGDLCLDIAEAFMDNKSFEEAKTILGITPIRTMGYNTS